MGHALTKPMRQEWARVRIHLNDRNLDRAAQAAAQASSITQWERFGGYVRFSAAAAVYSTDELPLGWCWFEPGQYRLLMPRATLIEHGLNYWLANYTTSIRRLSGPCFLSYSSDAWHSLDALDDIVRADDDAAWV